METATLNWCSLKPIKINNLRLTFSWGSDTSKKPIFSQIDLRLFYNGLPTTYGVNLTRWELLHLGGYIQERSVPDTKTFYELTVESASEGLTLNKRKGRLFIKNHELAMIEMLIPGLNYIACLMKPDEPSKNRLFEDVFIYSLLLKSEIKSLNEAFKEEEMLSNSKLSAENLKFLKQNCMKMWDCYSANFGEISPISRNDFLLKFSGDFLKSLREISADCPALLRSITHVIKSIADFK